MTPEQTAELHKLLTEDLQKLNFGPKFALLTWLETSPGADQPLLQDFLQSRRKELLGQDS